MAKRRVQVERLRPSAKLQAVARPVETYVRPAKEPVGPSDLGAFISAIAPAAESMAKLEKEKQLKLQREAERGIASARAFDAKLGAGKALRAAYEDFSDPANSEAYLNMTPEQVRDKRAEIMQPFFDKVQQSGDDKLALAFQQDIELGNLNFFTQSYDPLKRKHDLSNSLNEVFTEVMAVQDNPMLDDNLKDKATDELLKTYQQATQTPWNAINEYAIKLTANNVGTRGRFGLYRWLEKENQLNVAKYADDKRVIDTRLASYDSDQLKLGKDAFFSSAVVQQISNFAKPYKDGGKDVQSIGGTITFKDGTTRAVKDEDIIIGIENYVAKSGLSYDEAVKQFYGPLGLVPTEDSNAIMSGKYLLSAGDITEETLGLMANAYMAYKKVDGYKLTIKDALLNTTEKKLMRAMDYLIEKRGVGPEGPSIGVVKEALQMVRTLDTESPTRKATTKEIEAQLDTGIFDISDFDEAVNRNTMLPYIQEGVDIYMQMGATLELATKEAIKDARKDFIIIESSVGTKHVLPILNTAINRTGREATVLQQYINESVTLKQVKNGITARGGAGLTLGRTGNPLMLDLTVVNDEGSPVGSMGQIPISAAANPSTITDIIIQRFLETEEDDKYVSGAMGVIIEPVEKQTIVEQNIPAMSVLRLPEGFDVETVEPLMIDGQPSGTYLYKGRLPDGSQTVYESSQRPETVLTPQTVPEAPVGGTADEGFIDAPVIERTVQEIVQDMNKDFSTGFQGVANFNQKQINELKQRALKTTAIQDMQGTEKEKASTIDRIMGFLFGEKAEAGRSDIAGDVENMQGTTMITKATNLIKTQEGFEPTPYKDGKDRSVGYGFYLPSLEADERALIKDVENITEAEAEAVLNLKISKIENYISQQLPAVDTLTEEAQAAVVSMMFQLGKENVVKKFPTFFKNLKLATEAPAGSSERQNYLKIASDNMIYNFKDGKKVSDTLWNKQTPNRAQAMAALVAEG